MKTETTQTFKIRTRLPSGKWGPERQVTVAEYRAEMDEAGEGVTKFSWTLARASVARDAPRRGERQMALVRLTLEEVSMIATYVLRGDEEPFSSAFETATAKFYGEDGFDPSDEASMSRVVVVELPADAVKSLPDRMFGVADDMDARAKLAAKETDYSSAERLHRGAGKFRALAVHTAREF